MNSRGTAPTFEPIAAASVDFGGSANKREPWGDKFAPPGDFVTACYLCYDRFAEYR